PLPKDAVLKPTGGIGPNTFSRNLTANGLEFYYTPNDKTTPIALIGDANGNAIRTGYNTKEGVVPESPLTVNDAFNTIIQQLQSTPDGVRKFKQLAIAKHLISPSYANRTMLPELADVVLPGSASWCESDGTVTNSERRVQRVRKAINSPGNAHDDIQIIIDLARELGQDWKYSSSEDIWDELRSLSPMHAGMSYKPSFLHGRLWDKDPAKRGRLAPFSVVIDEPPVESTSPEFPLRLTTGRRLDSYNTGVQTRGFDSPLRFGETIDVSPEDAAKLSIRDSEIVRVSSLRGSLEVPVRIDKSLRPGLVFMTMHFPDQVNTNLITIDATDPKSGTAEFKAAAVKIERIKERVPVAGE
ncbi:MAG: hypothetical protein EBU96_12180, partial [Actinobacteria bacterium]|nr:hypothetical protein [Actinomycetota bacterium]